MSGSTLTIDDLDPVIAPTVMTAAGLQPQQPQDLRDQLVAIATLLSPGLTANLPGTLIEDVASTDVGGLVVSDQARVEFVASLDPRGASPWLLRQLGNIYGVALGKAANTSVYVVFTGPPGYSINRGFQVSDGTYTYTIQTPGAIQAAASSQNFGVTQPMLAIAVQTGSWNVQANTVNQTSTSIQIGVKLTVTNPLPGTPGLGGQTEESYRADVLRAGLSQAQGTPAMVKTAILQVPGTADRLISMVQQSTGAWSIIVGGSGDTYAIGNAIYNSMGDIGVLTGSRMTVVGISNNSPAVITTALNHGYSNAQIIQINDAQGLTGINGLNLAVSVISPTAFSLPIDTTTLGTYQAGTGYCTPNFRNFVANVYDYPDTYNIPIIIPPLQKVTLGVEWNTIDTGFVSASSMAQAAVSPLAAYVNSIAVGQPINVFELDAVFQTAVAQLVPPALLTRIAFAVTIDGVLITPIDGTGIVQGDPESFLVTDVASISIVQQG